MQRLNIMPKPLFTATLASPSKTRGSKAKKALASSRKNVSLAKLQAIQALCKVTILQKQSAPKDNSNNKDILAIASYKDADNSNSLTNNLSATLDNRLLKKAR